ncbi:MAG: hypothetical protein Q9173_002677 [Seirophora scorigena]
MFHCLDRRSPPAPDHLSPYLQPFAFGETHWERPSEDSPQPVFPAASGQPNISPFAFMPRKAMPAGRDDSPIRRPQTTQAMALLGLQGQWYERLNRSGPVEPPIPFVDGGIISGHAENMLNIQADDPPFYLQKPSSDVASMQFRQLEQSSSRPGLGSQPPPLSHSLLSQLELSENDPNTFREVIDDLTVQNKKLKKHLRRCKRMCSNQLTHEGLFEVRVQNLSLKQKQELENLLQQFVSNIQSSEIESDHDAVYGPKQPLEDTKLVNRTSPSPSPNSRPVDSTYASVSTTGGTITQTPAPLAHAANRIRHREESPAKLSPGAAIHAVPQGQQCPDISSVSDKSKQKMIVERLEGLFLGEEVDEAALSERNDPNESPRQRHRGSHPSDTPQASSPMDSLLHLRHLGLASPLASPSSPSHDEWIYLNLLVNMAKLHILNVTPDFVRQAIRTVSARLVLSEDGGKVRWQGNLERTVVSPDYPRDNLSSSEAPRSADPESASSDQPQRIPSGNFATPHRDGGSGAGGGYQQRTDWFAVRAPRQTQAKQLHYKPLFIHTKRRRAKSLEKRHDGSSDGSISTSESEAFSMSPRATVAEPDPSNGPVVFFKTKSFFLDLSADVAKADRLCHSTYSTPTAEPLGGRKTVRKASHDYERKQELDFAAHPELSQSSSWNSLSRTTSPLLHVYSHDPTHAHDASHGAENFHFEASGIGGIQLNDNFAVDVKTSHQPSPNLRQQGPSRHRLHDTIARPISREQRTARTQCRSHEVLSITTTNLPPSPLPPPSFVYPTLSSSSSESEGEYDSLDDTDSDSDVEFRQVSLSPQMRTFLEQQDLPDSPYRNTYSGEASATGEVESDASKE